MNTITEDYVSFETAKLLKEKEFDEVCYLGYNDNGEFIPTGNLKNSQLLPEYYCKISAPTLQMAMKWLRKNYNIHIEAIPYVTMEGFYWAYKIVGGVIYRNNIPLPNYCIRVLNQKAALEHVKKPTKQQ